MNRRPTRCTRTYTLFPYTTLFRSPTRVPAMDWGAHLDTAALAAILGAVCGWFVPAVVGRLPEPENAAETKVTYAELAASPRIGWWTALWSAEIGRASCRERVCQSV